MEQSKKEKGTINSTQDSVKNQVQDSEKTSNTPPVTDEMGNEIDQEFSTGKSFPIDIFPQEIQSLIKNAEETVGFNPDFFSAGILSICATAIGTSVSLFNGSYPSQPILWLAIIGRSGIGKTHPLKFSKKPIEEKDKKSYEEFIKLEESYELEEKKGKKPIYIKSILTDFTIEKLTETLKYNPKGALIFKDELIGWINSFDQYKNGGDQQKYIESWNGDVVTADRVSKSPARVEKSNVNIIGGLQPRRLKELALNGRDDDGFLPRMLLIYPTNIKPNLFTGKNIEPQHIENYSRLINNLFDVSETTLRINENQIKIYQDWQHKAVKNSYDDDVETCIQAKLESYVWRLALVIEMIFQATENEFRDTISDNSLIKAIKLVEYFRMNALKVFDKIISTNPLDDLPTTKIELINELPLEFKRIDVIPLFNHYGIKGGSIGRFLNNNKLFKRLDSKGNYKKLII
ncbi:DUF3987 domain-containing protein [Polaribacter sp. BAL334]|uniref:DUF3987 domain-containing protein n=1 Tax=Polaribacter sp. BAL334 TaxID=1708178 RepID=UPI0018D26277|nr:DUF3987 domain-containing protein [Polaribacter sp. BAL334]MBG7611049.1 DUF3987 domain-containing protein [Polaribacter sp. BAL334]